MNSLKKIITTLESQSTLFSAVVSISVIIAGVGYSMYLGDILRFPDEVEYYSIANHLLDKNLYSIDGIYPTAYRPPGYPLFLTIFRFMGFGIVALRSLNFFLLSGSIGLLNSILSNSQTKKAGTISICICLCYPVFFYTAGTLYPQTLGAFLLLLFSKLILDGTQKSNLRATLAGLVMGFLLLTIPQFVVILAFSVAFLVIYKKSIKQVFLILVTTGAVMLPWVGRNFVALDAIVPFSTNSGFNLLLGNSPNTLPNSGVNVDLSEYFEQSKGLSEVEKDRFFRTTAFKYINENRYHAAWTYLLKFLNHFNYQNLLATKSEKSALKDAVVFLTFYPILILVLIRLVFYKAWKLADIEWFFIFAYLIGALSQAIFFTRIRFRVPYDFFLIGLAAIFLKRLISESPKFNKTSVSVP